MNIEYKDFIGFYRNVFPQGYCEYLIREFEVLAQNGVGATRQQREKALKHNKDDYHMQLDINIKNHNFPLFKWDDINETGDYIKCEWNTTDLFFSGLQKCYNEYTQEYSILANCGKTWASSMKMQRTPPSGGYHLWHSEQSEGLQANRCLVYMLYLNNLECDGGETEFLYQRMRIKPEENLMILWPASYTHAHRGNAVLGDQNKYVVTGWFYYD